MKSLENFLFLFSYRLEVWLWSCIEVYRFISKKFERTLESFTDMYLTTVEKYLTRDGI